MQCSSRLAQLVDDELVASAWETVDRARARALDATEVTNASVFVTPSLIPRTHTYTHFTIIL